MEVDRRVGQGDETEEEAGEIQNRKGTPSVVAGFEDGGTRP